MSERQISTDAVDAAAGAIHDVGCGCKDGPDLNDRMQAKAALVAALPHLREQIAADIERATSNKHDAQHLCPVCEAMSLSARIARGTATVVARGMVTDPR